jgi:16S rRNA (uracil1498-N3)-methyltransferase
MSEFIEADSSFVAEATWLADPEGTPVTDVDLPRTGQLTLLVGPEGGVTEAETTALVERGVAPICLAPHILRVETAALAVRLPRCQAARRPRMG